MKIIFIQTGGTIDKDYPKTQKGYAFEIAEPAVQRILEKLNPTFDFEIISVLKKDSLEITDEDRIALKNTCENITESKIIITHGTDTIIETAQFLSSIPSKTIVLTGAMRPERFSNSDAAINVGLAIGASQTLPFGVYVAMNGLVLEATQIARAAISGKFIPKKLNF